MKLSRVTNATLDVLEALIGADEELCGLKIAQKAGRKAGSVYPILARLEETGWVESFWEREERDGRGPRCRFYQLSSDGLAAARALLDEHRGAIGRRVGVDSPVRKPRLATTSLLSWRAVR